MPLNLKLLRRRHGGGDIYRRVNCTHLYPACLEIDRPHCRMSDSSGESRGDCFIYLGKATSCILHEPLIKKLTHNERLAITTKRSYQSRCVKNGLCPECATILNSDKSCRKCDLSWAYI